MSKVFRRPMFRKGGNVGEGIMTGIVDRENYANGPNMFDIAGPRTMDSGAPKAMNQSIDVPDLGTITERNVKALLEQAGPSEAYDPLTSFLLQYGPAAAKQTGGGTFANLIAAAEKPVASLIEAKSKESDFLRSLRTQAAGAAIKERSEMEQADIDRRFKKQLAEMQISSDQETANKQIQAAYEQARIEHERSLQRLAKAQELETKSKLQILEKGKELERMTPFERVERDLETGRYAEDYESVTEERRRSNYEHVYRDEIAKEYGEKRVGGQMNINMDDETQVNKQVKRKIDGGANKIYYNIADDKRYLLTEDGRFVPITPSTTKADIDTTVVDTAADEAAAREREKKEISERYDFLSPSQKKKIEELKEKNIEVPFGGTGA